MPVAIHVRLEPRGKIHGAIRRRHAHVAEVAGAIARGNVHAPAEGDGKMRVVSADASPLSERNPRRLRWASVRVAERDVMMHIVANGLNSLCATGRHREERPRQSREPVGLAVSTAEEKLKALLGEILHRML